MKHALLLSCLMALSPAVSVGQFHGETLPDSSIPIRFKTSATVTATTYKLEDVAEVGGNPRQRSRLSSLVLGRSPRPGQHAYIRRAEIVSRIARQMPELAPFLRWSGAARMRIGAGGVAYGGTELAERAQAHLEAWLRPRFPTAAVEPVRRSPKSMTVPSGRVDVRPRLSNAIRLAKRMPVWVDVYVDGDFFQARPVWFAVEAMAPALTIPRDLPAHYAPTAADVYEAVVDLAAVGAEPVSLGALESLRLKRALREGNVLTLENLEPLPAVSRGELITVYARHGSVAIETRGKATADGDIAESIEVENPDTGDSYYAIVIDKGTARVN